MFSRLLSGSRNRDPGSELRSEYDLKMMRGNAGTEGRVLTFKRGIALSDQISREDEDALIILQLP